MTLATRATGIGVTTLAIAMLAVAQQAGPPEDSNATGSITVTVRDQVTGQQVADAVVAVLHPDIPRDQSPRGNTNAQGVARLTGIPPGRMRVSTAKYEEVGFPRQAETWVTLTQGQDLNDVTLLLPTGGSIAGTITDQNGEPLPGMSVSLVVQDWQFGRIESVFRSLQATDDQGAYRFENLRTGVPFAVMVRDNIQAKLEPRSRAPLDPALRRPSFAWTFYPGTTDINGATKITLAPGETREHVDFEVERGLSFCVEGEVNFAGQEGNVRFSIVRANPHSGSAGNSAAYLVEPSMTVPNGTHVRTCGLAPGEYRVRAYPLGGEPNRPALMSTTYVTITDKDTGFVLNPVPRMNVNLAVVWDGPKPEGFAFSSGLAFFLQGFARASFGERAGAALTGDGPFQLELMGDEYGRRSLIQGSLGDRVYWKDLRYGNRSVMYEIITPGSVVGNPPLQIVLAADGGTIETKVQDKKGDPVAHQWVVVVPQSATTEAEFASRVIDGPSDQNGEWVSEAMAPGDYFVMAMAAPFDRSPETIARLWRARGDAAEVTVSPGGQAKVTLEAQP